MIDNQSKTVITLGMHRSGTSMIAGVLDKLGVNMGERMLGKDFSNPLGHFEDRRFISQNIKILEAANGSWDDPPTREAILRQKDKFQRKIKRLVNREGIWGWKDPRTSLTIELYLPYLINPYFIICYRNPARVALSLKRREERRRREAQKEDSRKKKSRSKLITFKQGMKLKKLYDSRIEELFYRFPDLNRLELNYEEVMDTPEMWVKEITDFLNINVDKEEKEEAIDFILPKDEIRELEEEYK
ncbi:MULTISPECIES: sulfotransferase family protein [unclassified Candidatus Frackibacter]|uniref:sulfotransferase family protein n=1 Tax=unclassified Candidatus Frackibacter TaxID=2648818 RepID=UPI00087E5D8B|nr:MULTISPECIES: sulfotransferase [unclassified Candidatus Frackibacter]SDC82678.1 Sulfotransferase family protein [Candidatus Frackibacter sp. WG11]SEM97155.1 Sulfotransferase family protein [Candidatus Frackibacter sp. WG12]SFM05806.1 Sulfotransferase family protein [Candidatus Frackibacter sp. WG13]